MRKPFGKTAEIELAPFLKALFLSPSETKPMSHNGYYVKYTLVLVYGVSARQFSSLATSEVFKKIIYKFPSLIHVPGVPATVHLHPLAAPTDGVLFIAISPTAHVPVDGAAVP